MRRAPPAPDERWPTAEEAARARLFQPIQIGRRCELRSRTWVPAMVPWRASPEGEVTPELLAWYERFATGRPGAIVVEATGIRDVPSGPLLRIGDARFLPGLQRLVEVVRRASGGETRLFIQLIDFLRVRRRPEPERYFRDFLKLRPEHRERLGALVGPDAAARMAEPALRRALAALPAEVWPAVLAPRELEELRFGQRDRVTDVHLSEVRDLPRTLPVLFAAAAARAREAGFDGVELHAAHAYTLAGFLSPLNTRADGYGGPREGRIRLPLEVYERVRGAVGADFVVGCRLLADEAIPGGGTVDDAEHNAVAFASAGIDFLSLSVGGKFEDARQPRVGEAAYPYTGPSGAACMPTVHTHERPWGIHLPLARRIRATVRAAGLGTPIVAAGGLHTFTVCEEALARGDVDVCAAARQTLADPDWIQKVRRGRGAEVRRCALTNYCEGLDQRHKRVTCRLWDRLPPACDEPDDLSGVFGTRRAGEAGPIVRLVAPRWRAPG